jgi:hypothetical protein
LAFCLVRPAMKEVERVKEGRRVDRINLWSYCCVGGQVGRRSAWRGSKDACTLPNLIWRLWISSGRPVPAASLVDPSFPFPSPCVGFGRPNWGIPERGGWCWRSGWGRGDGWNKYRREAYVWQRPSAPAYLQCSAELPMSGVRPGWIFPFALVAVAYVRWPTDRECGGCRWGWRVSSAMGGCGWGRGWGWGAKVTDPVLWWCSLAHSVDVVTGYVIWNPGIRSRGISRRYLISSVIDVTDQTSLSKRSIDAKEWTCSKDERTNWLIMSRVTYDTYRSSASLYSSRYLIGMIRDSPLQYLISCSDHGWWLMALRDIKIFNTLGLRRCFVKKTKCEPSGSH